MLLTIDVGNTNIKIGVYNGDELCFISRMATDSTKLEDQYAVELSVILTLYHLECHQIDGAVIGSVVPPITKRLRRAIRKLFNTEAVIVKYDTDPSLEIAIQNPRETGADLILACVAAKELYSCPCIIIDMGTATKLIVMDREKCMLGGCIAPGLGISMNAMFSQAALLTTVSMEKPEKVIGDSTIACIQSGAIYGSAAMLDNMCDRIEEELGYTCQVIATGGLAETVVKCCKRSIIFNETLVLEGLRIIYDKNKKA